MTELSPALSALAARYAHWLGLPVSAVDDTSDEDPDTVCAMQVILHVERAAPPPRTALLEVAATAAVALCLDERSAPGGEWHPAMSSWVKGRIRKVSRRARGAHWHAAQHLPGLTAREWKDRSEPASPLTSAEARALVPGPVAELPREVSRLQVAGTDLPHDEPGPPPPGVPILWLNPAVPMTVGKAAAQVGHATMIAAALLGADRQHDTIATWAADRYRVAVRTPSRQVWRDLHPGDDPLAAWRRRRVVAVRDAGFTEVAPGTITVLAQLPPG